MTKITIWTVVTCFPDGNTCKPLGPNVFTTEAAAVAYLEEQMRGEWESNAPLYNDDDGERLPYPGNWQEAQDAIIADMADGDPDELWGEYRLQSHTLEIAS